MVQSWPRFYRPTSSRERNHIALYSIQHKLYVQRYRVHALYLLARTACISGRSQLSQSVFIIHSELSYRDCIAGYNLQVNAGLQPSNFIATLDVHSSSRPKVARAQASSLQRHFPVRTIQLIDNQNFTDSLLLPLIADFKTVLIIY